MGLLLRDAGIAGAHVLAHDLAVTGVEKDDGALPARLSNGADLHVVSGTRLPRRWPTCPQLGGCLNPNRTRSGDARSILLQGQNYSLVIVNTMSVTKRRKDSFSTNCL